MSSLPATSMNVEAAAAPKRRIDVAFIIVAAILLIAAIGLNTAVKSLKLSFRKEPVALQMPLKEIAARFGPWLQVSADERLPHETEEALATHEYVFRDYVDTRILPADAIRSLEGKSAGERQAWLGKVRDAAPQAVMNMAVTYYTGMVDTVAHIPDRCYVADGFNSSETQTVRWACFDSRGDSAGAQFIHFEDNVARRGASSRNVAYFFHVNGRYTNDSIDVRTELQNLFQKHGYYAKIELLSVVKDRGQAAAVIDDFLRHALPEVEKSLPDWKKIKAGEKSAGR